MFLHSLTLSFFTICVFSIFPQLLSTNIIFALFVFSIALSFSLLLFSSSLSVSFFPFSSLSSLTSNSFEFFVFDISSYYICFFLFIFILFYFSYLPSVISSNYSAILLIFLYFFGLIFLLLSNDFLVFYISLEFVALTSYLLAILHQNPFTIEASLKYFIYSFLSGAIFLLGVSIVYFHTSSISFVTTFSFISSPESSPFIYLGFLLIFFTLFFKLSIVPFHFWAPDLYEGIIYPLTALFSLFPKFIFYPVIIKFSLLLSDSFPTTFSGVFTLLGFLSLLLGTFSAYNQFFLKRLLAYSTISNSGLLLILLGTFNFSPIALIIFFIYFLTYLLASHGIFNFLIHFNLTKFNSRLPFVASSYFFMSMLFAVCLLSYAGIPPFVGFVGKLFILFWLISSGYILLAIFVILYSLISIVYYLKFLHFMLFTPPSSLPSSLTSSQDLITPNYPSSWSIYIISSALLIWTFNPSFLFLISSNIAYSFF